MARPPLLQHVPTWGAFLAAAASTIINWGIISGGLSVMPEAQSK